MAFIQNRWYAASWSDDLTDKPLGRRIADKEITLFRKSDGTVAAVSSRCPHRFAPMYYGEVIGDNIRCRYHGLLFDGEGKCVENPDGSKPPPMCLDKFHVVEDTGMIWVWIGESEPDVDVPHHVRTATTPPSGAMAKGYLHVKCNYLSLLDNLVDHSHAPQLHELLRTDAAMSNSKHDLHYDEDEIMLETKALDTKISPFLGAIWDGAKGNIDQRIRSTWTDPGNIAIEAAITNTGEPWENGTTTLSVHLIVPETENTSHYFWGQARCDKLDDEELTKKIGEGLSHIFLTEDAWMIEGQQKMMDGEEFWSLKPAMLPQDKGTVMVRRRIEKILKEQAAD
jgi:vanillate O-demethylase monooxygenase subunit